MLAEVTERRPEVIETGIEGLGGSVLARSVEDVAAPGRCPRRRGARRAGSGLRAQQPVKGASSHGSRLETHTARVRGCSAAARPPPAVGHSDRSAGCRLSFFIPAIRASGTTAATKRNIAEKRRRERCGRTLRAGKFSMVELRDAQVCVPHAGPGEVDADLNGTSEHRATDSEKASLDERMVRPRSI